MRATLIAAAVSLALAGPAAIAQSASATDDAKASSSANTASSSDTSSSADTASSGSASAAGADSTKGAADSTASGSPTTAPGATRAEAGTPNTAQASRLIGQKVENPNGDNIGKVNDLIIDPKTGQVQQVVVGVGGFLGIGQKDVALPWDQLQIRQEVRRTETVPATGTSGAARAPEFSPAAPGAPSTRAERAPGSEMPAASREVVRTTGLHIVANMTKEQLKDAPEYEKDKGPTLGMAPSGDSRTSSRDTTR